MVCTLGVELLTSNNKLFAWLLYFILLQMKKEEFIKILENLQNDLHDRIARPEDVLELLRDTVEQYGIRNENEELWENYKTSWEIEEMLQDALECWLERVYYFINNLELLHNAEVIYVDNYGNCDVKVTYNDLWNVIENILDSIE